MSAMPWRRAAVLVLLAAIFVVGAIVQGRLVNVDYGTHDQGAYLDYAFSFHGSRGEAIGNRLQMPALPALLARFVRDGDTRATFFPRAKWICLLAASVAAALTALLLRARLPREPAIAVGLVTTFFVFAFRAPYVQAEPLSYATIFALFLLMCEAWRRPSWPIAAAVGLVLAGAFMIKATALLGFYVLAIAVVVRAAIDLARERSARALAPLGQAALSFAVFLAAIWPYAKNSRRYFGHWLYNMSSEYVMWCDSWPQFLDLQSRLDLVHRAPTLPPDEVPSPSTYWHHHTLAQMFGRELRGLAEVGGNCLLSHGYAPFVLVYVAVFVAMLRKHADVRRAMFRPDSRALAWFVVPYLAVHLLLFGWYGPIAAGNRFVLAIFVPAVWAVAAGLSAHCKPSHTLVVFGRPFDWRRVNVALAALLVLELIFYFPYGIATHYSGG